MIKVSVILPVSAVRPSYFKKSVGSIIGQDFKDWELILVLDHPPSKIKKIAEGYKSDKRIKVIENNFKLGLTKSVNKAARLAQGEYLCRMDADDIALPQRLSTQLEFMEGNKQIQLCGSWVGLVDSNGKTVGVKSPPVSWASLKKVVFHYNPMVHPTWFFRRSFWLKTGGFDEKFKYAQDHEFLLRTIKRYPIVNINKILLKYRVNDNNAISVKKLKSQQWFSIVARYRFFKNFGFNPVNVFYLFKALVSFALPKKINLLIYRLIFWR